MLIMEKNTFIWEWGSHSDCLMICSRITGRFIEDRKPLPAIVLGNNGSSLTAIANDYSYEESFSRELDCLGIENDVFLLYKWDEYIYSKKIEFAKKIKYYH